MKWYEALGLPDRCSDTSQIKKAYRAKALQHHPDKQGGDAETFKSISAAYEVLSDPAKKQEYDQFGDKGRPPPTPFGGGGGFPFPFPQRQTPNVPPKAANVIQEIHVTLLQAYQGVELKRAIQIEKKCPSCVGACPRCHGGGVEIAQRMIGPGMIQTSRQRCTQCSGTGEKLQANKGCFQCGGTGSYSNRRQVSMKLPPGVQTGHQEVIYGCGVQRVASSGDLLFRILVDMPSSFRRVGNDLLTTVSWSFEDTLGRKQVVLADHPQGKKTVCPWERWGIVQSGKQYRMPGLGMPDPKDTKKTGDLILQFDITYPSKVTPEYYQRLVSILQEVFPSSEDASTNSLSVD